MKKTRFIALKINEKYKALLTLLVSREIRCINCDDFQNNIIHTINQSKKITLEFRLLRVHIKVLEGKKKEEIKLFKLFWRNSVTKLNLLHNRALSDKGKA